ncbi:MAG: NADH-quinone oxidoreductase subunit NuoH [Deltaproteobacteria bacterium]|nr:MAG: NADH-quinone oxidoreductase subunit NuoH [Deltaproteobacteria bacterium]
MNGAPPVAASGLLFNSAPLHALVLGLVVVSLCMGVAAWSIWYERKFAARMQNRPGPTEVGPWGLLQPIADGLKMLQKEDIVPAAVDRPLFELAPLLVVVASLGTLAVIPWGDGLVIADLHIGVLFALALSSLMLLPVWMAGWASNNKYALLGGMRAIAQGVSYEIPLLLAATVPIVLAGSFRLGDIVEAQAGLRWFALWPPGPGAVAFVLFFMASLAEANRIPFDIPEAESELVAGVTVEYTGMKFGMFYLAEYLHTLIASAIAATLFLGGWDMGPLGAGVHWMVLKTLVLFAVIFWIRWSWLRLRADQLMALSWRWLVPLGLVLVMASATWVVLA